MFRSGFLRLLVTMSVGLLFPRGPTWAQVDKRVARASYTVTPPKIDGDLNEPAWRAAPWFGGFSERQPILGQLPPEDTTFSVLFDEEALYFGVRCQDRRKEQIRGLAMQRDSGAIFSDDAVSIKLDPASDRRTTLGFVLNPASGQLDYRGINESEFRIEFDAVWQGEARRNEGGWSAEFRIPFASLGLSAQELPPRIGLNISRDHSRRSATYDWALLRPPFGPIAASRYGDLVGLDQRPPRRGHRLGPLQWAVIPYLTGAFRPGTASQLQGSGGLDLRLRRGERLGVHLSLNTDFSQADLDDQRVNLSRFSLFFPEKRDFFLRDVEIFSFGIPREAQLLQTRRIGLSAQSDGVPVPLLDGLKITARPHRMLRVGLLQAVSLPSPTGDQPWTLFLVGRGLLELAGGSNVGMMMTYRQSLDRLQDRNFVLGIDGAMRSFGNLLVTAYGLLSLTGAEAGMGALATGGAGTGDFADRPAPGGGLEVSWRGLLLRPRLRYSYFDPELRADLGFYRRVGVHDVQGEFIIEPRIKRHRLERLTIDLVGGVVAGAQPAQLLDYRAQVDIALRWNIGFLVGAYGGYYAETVQRPFEIGHGVSIPVGLYKMWQTGLRAETPYVWPLSGSLNLRFADNYGGIQSLLDLGLTAQPITGIQLTAAAELQHTQFSDARGELFTATLNGRLGVGFSPKLGFDTFVAWNSLADLVRVQARLRHRYLDGSDIFLVFQSDMDQAGRVHALSLLAKLTLQWQR